MKPHDPDIIYRRLVEHMNEAVWVGDARECTVYANPKFCELMEMSLEEMLGRESYEFWDPESAERVRRVNSVDRKKGVVSSYEGNLLSKSGKRIPVLLSGTPLPEGGTIGIMTDLRQLKEKEEQARNLSQAIMYGTDAMVNIDASGVIRSWNKGAKMIFGFSREEIEGKKLTKLLPRDASAMILHQCDVQYNFELSARHQNGQELTISAIVCPLFRGKGSKPHAFLLIGRDITSQRKFEEGLTVKYQKMREAYNRFGITRRQMDYVFDLVALSAAGRSSRQAVAEFVVNAVIMLSHADACILRLLDAKGKVLTLVASFGVSDDWKGKANTLFKGSLAEKAFQQGMPVTVIDLAKEPKYTSSHLAKKHNFCSALIIPLTFHSAFIGSITLYVTPEKKLELFENDFIEKYAALVGTALATVPV